MYMNLNGRFFRVLTNDTVGLRLRYRVSNFTTARVIFAAHVVGVNHFHTVGGSILI